MRPRLTSALSLSNKVAAGDQAEAAAEAGMSVRDEYMEAVKSKSYMDMWNQVQEQSQGVDYAYLLEPNQGDVAAMVAVARTHCLVLRYLDAGLAACNLCGSLINSISLARCRALTLADRPPPTRAEEDGVLDGPGGAQFQRIVDVYEAMVGRLVSAHKRVMRRAWLVALVNKACGFGPVRKWERIQRVAKQLDAAARGAYAHEREMETLGRMAARVRGEGTGVSPERILDQLGELEEHVYLLLLNINRARRMVVEEILAS